MYPHFILGSHVRFALQLASYNNLVTIFMASCKFTSRLVQPLIVSHRCHAWLSLTDRPQRGSSANQS